MILAQVLVPNTAKLSEVNPQNSDPADGKAPGGEDRVPWDTGTVGSQIFPTTDPWVGGEGRAASRSDHFSPGES